MRIFAIICLSMLLFLFLHDALAQQTSSRITPEQGGPLARLSYASTYFADGNRPNYSPKICFELYRNRRYRMSRMTAGTESLEGSLSWEQFNIITDMLGRLDFKSSTGAIIHNGVESFVAEVARGDETLRYIWVNPDHQRPFPDSAARVIEWLQQFKPYAAIPLTVPERSGDPICPRMSDKPFQPVLPTQFSCGRTPTER